MHSILLKHFSYNDLNKWHTWCKENCINTFTFNILMNKDGIYVNLADPTINFESEDDLIQFQLRWQ